MTSPVVSEFNGEFEFDTPTDAHKRAPILQHIYFHENEELKVYPSACDAVDLNKMFIDVTFKEEKALAGCEAPLHGWDRLSNLFLNSSVQFESPLNCSGLSICEGNSKNLCTVLKILCDKG
jgi:hypothetical protein